MFVNSDSELAIFSKPGSDVGGRRWKNVVYVSCASIPCTWIATHNSP